MGSIGYIILLLKFRKNRCICITRLSFSFIYNKWIYHTYIRKCIYCCLCKFGDAYINCFLNINEILKLFLNDVNLMYVKVYLYTLLISMYIKYSICTQSKSTLYAYIIVSLFLCSYR